MKKAKLLKMSHNLKREKAPIKVNFSCKGIGAYE
jgi:hypothetical protein